VMLSLRSLTTSLDRVKPSQSHIFAKSEKRVAAQTPLRKMINHPSRKGQNGEK